MDKLNDVGLYLQTAVAQPMVTKKRVVECLLQIGQNELAGILIKRLGMIGFTTLI